MSARRTIKKIEVFEVKSQPGDSTRYNFVMRLTGDTMWFFPDGESSIRYPTYLDIKQVESLDTTKMDDEELLRLADWHNCNVWTLAECIRALNVVTGHDVYEIH